MSYGFHFLVDPGRIRTNNEDAIMVDPRVSVAALADGMGGYNAGEVASTMAASLLVRELVNQLEVDGPLQPREVVQALEAAADHANRTIFEASQAQPAYRGMGTTLVVGVFQPQRLYLGHVGDSRAYRWRCGELTQLTRDHSLLQEQIDAGVITREQAAVSVHRNLVTRALGIEHIVHMEIHEHAVEAGDCFLLCSDGLTDMLDDAAIAGILARRCALPAKTQALVDAANASGGQDNIAVLLAQESAADPRRGWLSRFRDRWTVTARGVP